MTEYNPEAGSAAYASVEALINNTEVVDRRTCKLEPAIMHVIKVARFIDTKKLKPKLENLAGLDVQYVENLRPFAWAAWYCSDRLASASATEERQRVDPSVLERAKQRRKRMIRVLDYHMGDDRKVAQEIDDLTPGRGYADLAHDLGRLAILSETYKSEIEHDSRHYRPEDASEARADAQTIVRSAAVSDSEEVDHWQGQLDRAYSAMAQAYEEVQAAAQWIWRRDPEIVAVFQPLARVARAPRRKRPKQPNAAPPAAEAPSTPKADES